MRISANKLRLAFPTIAIVLAVVLCAYYGWAVNRQPLTPEQSAKLAAEDAAVSALRSRSWSFFDFESGSQKVSSSKDGEDWWVIIQSVPAMPGGDTMVVVGPNGTVKRIIPGR